jgi:DNA uptake protein ComE-like DNA-binding protein
MREQRAVKLARSEADAAAAKLLAEREGELAAELEQAGDALRAAELQLREAEQRAEAAEKQLGASAAEELKRTEEEREGRFRALEERIGKVTSRASTAQARAAASEIELPEEETQAPGAEVPPVRRIEAEPPREVATDERPTDEHPAVKKPRRLFGRLRRAKVEAPAEAEPKPKTEAKVPSGRTLDANKASFEELRGLGMSVTQATRVIAYRERAEGFKTLDDMDTIPGFDKDFLDALKQRLKA